VRSLDYVILFVEDIDASMSFYRELLGGDPSTRSETYAEFRLSNLRLGLYDRARLPELIGREGSAGGPDSEILFLVDDADAEAERLRASGVQILSGPIDRPWGHRTVHLVDPDGHVIELAQEIPRRSPNP